ncbi:MAG: apolipoprotein N-acyltransferase [Candidatus Methylomirabilia bacterium]
MASDLRLALLTRAKARVPLLVASAALGHLAYPQTDWHLLIWVSLAPVFACAMRRSPWQAFADGWIHGLTFFILLLRWLDYTFQTYSLIPWPITWLPLLGLAGYCALYTGLVAAAVSWLGTRVGTGWALASAPVLWVAAEWLRGHLLSGFPWGLLGYSQASVLPVIQVAEWTGVYGVSFLIAGTNAALAAAAALSWRRAWGGQVALAALLLATVTFGWQLLPSPETGRLRVVVVQPSIDQAQKWDPELLDKSLGIYRALTLKAAEVSPALVVWPETAAPIFLRRDPATLARVRALAGEIRAPVLLGSVDSGQAGDGLPLNSAFLVTKQGIGAKYDKMHLVPFGEYVPLSRLLGFVRGWAEFISDFAAGRHPVVFGDGRAPFGVVICYEGLFPELFRQFVKGGAEFMVNITNDAWFGTTGGPWQHLAVLPLRAVENRVAIARAANTGVSAIIAPSGQIRQSLGLFRRGTIEAQLPLRTRRTFYTRYGDVFAYTCIALAILAGCLGCWRPWASVRPADEKGSEE